MINKKTTFRTKIQCEPKQCNNNTVQALVHYSLISSDVSSCENNTEINNDNILLAMHSTTTLTLRERSKIIREKTEPRFTEEKKQIKYS